MPRPFWYIYQNHQKVAQIGNRPDAFNFLLKLAGREFDKALGDYYSKHYIRVGSYPNVCEAKFEKSID